MPVAQYEQIAQRPADAGVRHEWSTRPHGLFCHRRETFREKPAEDGWNRVRELLAGELS